MGLGLCVVDHFYVVEGLDASAERTRYVERLVCSGGMVGNALCQAAALGCEAHALSELGDDADGRFVRRSLRGSGVNTRRLRLAETSRTTVAVVLVDRRSGERRFVVPDRRALERGVADFDLSPIRAGSVLLVDAHFPDQALRAVRSAREVGARVVADFHRTSPAVRRLLPFVDHAVVARELWETIADDPEDAVAELARRYGGAPVVTRGSDGGWYWDEGRVRRYRAKRARVRDTTGAGDAFHGAFAAGLARGAGLGDAVALAARAAAVCCTALGGNTRLLYEARLGAAEDATRRARAKR